MEVNVFGTIALTKAFLELIRESKGRVINVSSLGGLIAVGMFSGYCASKFALEGFTDSLRKEMLPLGVSVSLINPGFVSTKIGEKDKVELHEQTQYYEQKWLDLYGKYLTGATDKITKNFADADTTDVTTKAIAQASFDPRPSARYFVAGANGFPAVVAAFIARAMPAYLNDRLVEIFSE